MVKLHEISLLAAAGHALRKRMKQVSQVSARQAESKDCPLQTNKQVVIAIVPPDRIMYGSPTANKKRKPNRFTS